MATWTLQEDVGAALKRQLRAADWHAAGDLEAEQAAEEQEAMPVTPAAPLPKRGRKRKEPVVEHVSEDEEAAAEVSSEDQPSPAQPSTPAAVRPTKVAKEAKDAKEGKEAKDGKEGKEGKPPIPAPLPVPEHDDSRCDTLSL